MRVAIETTSLRGPLAGIGHYVHRLIEALLPLLTADEELIAFDGLSCRPINSAFVNAVEGRNLLLANDGVQSGIGQYPAYNAFLALRQFGALRRAFRYLKEKRFQATEKHFDVFHAVQMLPPGPFTKPILPVFHDLSHIRFPDAHPRERVRWLEKRLPLLADVPFIQAVSQFTKAEIVEILGIPPDRIYVTYPGIAPHFTDVKDPIDAIHLAHQGVETGQYFLVVSTREPRKNFTTVAEAYASLPDALRASAPLLWVGQHGWGDLPFSAAVERARRKGEIRILGYVSDPQLASLYRHTALFMMPSRYEGFGMPITEALACRASIAVSDIPVFREVAGTYARYVQPMDVTGWCDAMHDALDGNGGIRVPPVDRWRWLERYSWHANATSTLKLYRRLGSSI